LASVGVLGWNGAMSSTAPHLVEPALTQLTDDTFEDFHEAISRGFQETPRPETRELDRRVFENERMFGHLR
jgi:hypothetical protein